ncbi:hypothetical protein J6TS1_07680 [Siminovitchia terrae]|uniref:Uncharacterized protein n=1 Tax=Siminovitchia terrae TaxID=1914933 RepID=A0ABQ4KS80_SIMTE|nr:hypothetical protein [Siminovitchia terrae]GIN94898.1 hypothetical protein J6TS1_07680 [Siminovitchia terrae]
MELVLEIVRIILPVVIVGGIGVFVVKRLKHKYDQGKLGKKESKGAQALLDSLIPLGILFGCAISVIFSIFFSTSLLSAVSLGAGIGLLFGYFAYEFYSRKRTKHS